MKRSILSMAIVGALACAPERDSTGDRDSRLMISLGGTATVAPGLEVPMTGEIFAVAASADRSFESLACAASSLESEVTWMDGPKVGERPLSWKVFHEPTLPRIRGYAVLVTNSEAAWSRWSSHLPPPRPGDLFGASRIIDVRPCEGKQPPEGCYAGAFPGEHVTIDTVFEGCR